MRRRKQTGPETRGLTKLRVDDEILNQLDDFEASSHYRRKQVEITLGARRSDCWIYVPDPEFYAHRKLITSGDWAEYAKTKTDWPGDTWPDETEG